MESIFSVFTFIALCLLAFVFFGEFCLIEDKTDRVLQELEDLRVELAIKGNKKK